MTGPVDGFGAPSGSISPMAENGTFGDFQLSLDVGGFDAALPNNGLSSLDFGELASPPGLGSDSARPSGEHGHSLTSAYNLNAEASVSTGPLAIIRRCGEEDQNTLVMTLGTATTGTPLSLFAGAAVTLTAASMLLNEKVVEPLGEAAGEAFDRGAEMFRDITAWAGEQWNGLESSVEMPVLPAPSDLINWIAEEVGDPVDVPDGAGDPSKEKTPILPPPPTTPPAREPGSEDPYVPDIKRWKPPAEPWTHPTPRPPRRPRPQTPETE